MSCVALGHWHSWQGFSGVLVRGRVKGFKRQRLALLQKTNTEYTCVKVTLI